MTTRRDDEPDAFFYAELKTAVKDEVLKYVFECVAATDTDPDYIHGLWNIYRNVKPVCTGW